ncbi:MAG: hypothetical protein ABW162_16385 [Candidatus Sedimenticola sp. PURPLELP]
MFRYKSHAPFTMVVVFLFLLLIGGSVQASACKGLSDKQCAAESGCSWVDGYKRSDGRNVSAHCKARPKGKKAVKSDKKIKKQ